MPVATEPRPCAAANALQRSTNRPPKIHVLVVDDCVNVRTYLGLWLTGLGCDVTTADCGEAALRAVARKAPDIILLDVLLPGTNGFDICERLKQGVGTRAIPVVMISGLQHPGNVRRAREVGATHYLAKPFDELALMFVIEGIRDLAETPLRAGADVMSR
jgi:CheY-like chemotaxis protein